MSVFLFGLGVSAAIAAAAAILALSFKLSDLIDNETLSLAAFFGFGGIGISALCQLIVWVVS